MFESAAALQNRITAILTDPICGMYRFEIPLRGFMERAWSSAVFCSGLSPTFDFVVNCPLLTQRHYALAPSSVDVLHANGCRFIHDIDDLLWSIPADNLSANVLSTEHLANIDGSLRAADIVSVSTEPLAAALEQRGIPAVIIPNLLDPNDWRVLPKGEDRQRLRVGWYGQRNCHVEDLAILQRVIAQLSSDVDFVFFGDLPPGMGAYRDRLEVYEATSIGLFPTMLAMLDLDVLLSPLVKNAFNECKSNLRILQAGMLGYAVIATDIEPHRMLPVALVENTPEAWIAAIRERIDERDAVRAEGRRLNAAVRERFVLDDRWAERIFTTWTGRAPVVI